MKRQIKQSIISQETMRELKKIRQEKEALSRKILENSRTRNFNGDNSRKTSLDLEKVLNTQ